MKQYVLGNLKALLTIKMQKMIAADEFRLQSI